MMQVVTVGAMAAAMAAAVAVTVMVATVAVAVAMAVVAAAGAGEPAALFAALSFHFLAPPALHMDGCRQAEGLLQDGRARNWQRRGLLRLHMTSPRTAQHIPSQAPSSCTRLLCCSSERGYGGGYGGGSRGYGGGGGRWETREEKDPFAERWAPPACGACL